MRICMLVLNNLLNDARVQKEARSLAQAGYRVTVFALHVGQVPSHEQLDDFQVIRIHLKSDHLKLGPFTQYVRYFEFTIRAAYLMMRFKPQVCHAHAIQALPACWLATRYAHSCLIYDAHEFEQGRDFSTAFRIPLLMQKLWTLPEDLFIRSADAIITVSDSIAQELVTSYQITTPIVIRNCPEKSNLNRQTTTLYERYSIPCDIPVIIYQGGLSEGRGLREFVRSAELVKNTAFVIVGDGALGEDLRQDADHLGEKAFVIFTGRLSLEQLPEVTASATIGVVLTENTCLNHFLTLPNKLFEYLQAGIPVIGSNMPEIARIIHDYQVGEVLDTISSEVIANSIIRLLSDPDYYRYLEENALKAAQKLNWGVESQKLLSLYQKFV